MWTRTERRPDTGLNADWTHWPRVSFGLRNEPSEPKADPSSVLCLVCVHVCVPSASGRRSDRVHGEAGECLCALALCSLCVRPASTKSKLSAHSGSTWRSHCARFDFTQSADIRFHCTVIGNQFEFLRNVSDCERLCYLFCSYILNKCQATYLLYYLWVQCTYKFAFSLNPLPD